MVFCFSRKDLMWRRDCHSLPISVVAVLQLLWCGTSLAQFVREEVSIHVHGDYCTVEGTYEFANTQDHATLWPIFYPLLNTATIPLADSIHVHDGDTGDPIPFERGSNGTSFSISMPPLGSKTVRITYLQRTPKQLMEYVLTTTKHWGRPLAMAIFRVVMPNSLRLTHISIPYGSRVERGDGVEYIIRKRAFMPRLNLIFQWERRRQ